jgi:hypothetical protein
MISAGFETENCCADETSSSLADPAYLTYFVCEDGGRMYFRNVTNTSKIHTVKRSKWITMKEPKISMPRPLRKSWNQK